MSDFNEFVIAINKIILWFKDFNQNIYDWSINLLSWSYETLVSVVLHTPLFLFNNSFVQNTSIAFSLISVSLVVLLTIYESIMKMLRKKHTDFGTIMKRFPLAIAGAGFAPILFEKGFNLINRLTKGITALGSHTLTSDTFTSSFAVGSIDVFGLLFFDIVLIALLIPILLQNAKRWWDLFCLSAITPLSLTAWIFDRHSHFFNQWWSNIKRLSLVQLVYAVFILLLGVFIYGTRFISPDAYLFKILIIIGGLFRLANPPQFVLSYSKGEDIVDTYKNHKNAFKRIKDTVTLKNFTPLQMMRESKEKTNKKISQLRKKHGRRHVKDLL